MKKKKRKQKISRSARQRRQVRRSRLAAIVYRLLLVVLVLAAGTAALTIFFRLDHIEVEGTSRYEQAALENTLGLKKGDNLFFFRKHAAETRLEQTYPYLDEVRITRSLPDTLVLHVTEAVPVIALEDASSSGYYLANASGKLLEHTDEAGAADLPLVTGVRVEDAQPGEQIPQDADGRARQLLYLTARLNAWGLLPETDFINVSALYDVRVGYGGRLDIRLGEIESADDSTRAEGEMALLDKKLRFAIYILEQKLTPSDIVVIDLTDVTRASTRIATAEQIAASSLPITQPAVSEQDGAQDPGGTDEN